MEFRLPNIHSPYYLLKERRHRWIISFAISGFVWLFLCGFGVFEFDYFPLPQRFLITGVYAAAGWIAIVIHLFLIQETFLKQLTFGNSIGLFISIMCSMGLFNFAITTLLFRLEPFSLLVLLKNQLFVLGIGTIVTPFCVLLHFNYLLKKKAMLNDRFDQLISDATISLRSENGKEELELSLNDLCYIQASGNYVDVYYRNGSEISHMLLRNSISVLEKEFSHTSLVRCHRKYLINVKQAQKMRRSNHQLKIESTGEMMVIPVSRSYKDRVNRALALFI